MGSLNNYGHLVDDVAAPVRLLCEDEGLSHEPPDEHHELVQAEPVQPHPLPPHRREKARDEVGGGVWDRFEAVHHGRYLLGQLLLRSAINIIENSSKLFSSI